MMNSKHSKKMDDLAEKIALDDFDKVNNRHEFSDTYTHKKKLFLEEIRMKRKQPQTKRKRNRILIAAACLLIGMPTTVLGAFKAYDMIVQKQNYEVNVSVINKIFKKSDIWYKMEVGYLPEDMEANDTLMKYSFKDNYAKGGFSFILWRLGKNSDFQTLYSNGYDEKEINGRKAVIINKVTGSKNIMFDRQVFLLFEDEGIMLESYIGTDVSEEQMMKVIENIALEPTSKEKASYIVDYDHSPLFSTEDKSKKTSVIPLKKDSKQLYSVGQEIPITISKGLKDISELEYVVEKVEVFDAIADFKQDNFNEVGLGNLNEYKTLDQKNKLIPYKRDVYKVGNGKDSIHELIESPLVNLKFVYLTTTVKNNSDQATDEIYMHPSLQVLKFVNNTWNYAGEEGIAEESLMTGEVDYLEPHGTGKSFYNIGSIQPGQIMKVNLGFFVDEDKLDSIFLDVFRYSGFGKKEDMNAEGRWWIDIRQK